MLISLPCTVECLIKAAALWVVFAVRVHHLGVWASVPRDAGVVATEEAWSGVSISDSDSWAWAAGAGDCVAGLELSVVACERGVLRAGDAFFESAVRSPQDGRSI